MGYWQLVVPLLADETAVRATTTDPPWWLSGAVVTAVLAVLGAIAALWVKVVPITAKAINERAASLLRGENQRSKQALAEKRQEFDQQQEFIKYMQSVIRESAARLDVIDERHRLQTERLTREHLECEERAKHMEVRIVEGEERGRARDARLVEIEQELQDFRDANRKGGAP